MPMVTTTNINTCVQSGGLELGIRASHGNDTSASGNSQLTITHTAGVLKCVSMHSG
jgi:hypothetical protein